MQGKEFVSLVDTSKAGTVEALVCKLQEGLIPSHSMTKKKYFNAGLSAGALVSGQTELS